MSEQNSTPATTGNEPPQSLEVLKKGIRTSQDFTSAMSALMADLATGAVSPQIGNAICNAGGKTLKVVEMQHRWGRRTPESDGAQVLQLSEKK